MANDVLMIFLAFLADELLTIIFRDIRKQCCLLSLFCNFFNNDFGFTIYYRVIGVVPSKCSIFKEGK